MWKDAEIIKITISKSHLTDFDKIYVSMIVADLCRINLPRWTKITKHEKDEISVHSDITDQKYCIMLFQYFAN